MASPPRDDAWRPFRPDQQRVVLIRRDGALKPFVGFVLDFGMGRQGNEMLVTYVDDGITRALRTEWIPRRRLRAIRVDPNWVDGSQPVTRQSGVRVVEALGVSPPGPVNQLGNATNGSGAR